MHSLRISLLAGCAAGLSLFAQGALAATEIEWWHAMGGANGERVDKIAADFNASQDDYTVKPVFKGSYAETMTAAIAHANPSAEAKQISKRWLRPAPADPQPRTQAKAATAV